MVDKVVYPVLIRTEVVVLEYRERRKQSLMSERKKVGEGGRGKV